MNSEQTTELLPALAAAIAVMRDPKKNASNPHFRNRFADLGEVLDCIRDPIADNGLLVTQHVDGDTLRTRVWHTKSGQWIESAVPLLMDKKTAQAQGSAITYARRYALKALFGMHDTDDDGEAATRPPKKTEPVSQSQPAPQRTESKPEPFKDPEDADRVMGNCVTEDELLRWWYRVVASGFAKEEQDALAESAREHKAKIQEANA